MYEGKSPQDQAASSAHSNKKSESGRKRKIGPDQVLNDLLASDQTSKPTIDELLSKCEEKRDPISRSTAYRRLRERGLVGAEEQPTEQHKLDACTPRTMETCILKLVLALKTLNAISGWDANGDPVVTEKFLPLWASFDETDLKVSTKGCIRFVNRKTQQQGRAVSKVHGVDFGGTPASLILGSKANSKPVFTSNLPPSI